MPRVTKATNKKGVKSTNKTEVVLSDSISVPKKKSTTTKKATPKSTKKSSTKKTIKKEAPKKTSKGKTTKVATTKKVAPKSTKKSTTKKEAPKKTTKTATTAKKTTKSATKKKATNSSTKTRKAVTTKKKTTARTKKENTLEYYDLPYRYNQTIVKILAQTPTTLFVYWDISDADREKYVKEYGDNFFNDTTPILIVHNKTTGHSFEIEVNDFANSWYFNVSDAKCDYEIEFGRRKKAFTEISIPNDYVHITSSNVVEAPNNRILFEPNTKTLFFRNVKTNHEFSKDVSTFSFMSKISKIYNIYDIYKKIYKEEELLDVTNNPTSGSSSVFYTRKD